VADRVALKRRYPRVPYLGPVLVKKIGDENGEDLARTRVLGLGGCMFVSPRSLGRGSMLALLLSIKGSIVRTKARVVYELHKSPTEVEVGVEFLHLDAQGRAVLAGAVPTPPLGGY
jgi:PilZ domain-containing protein